MKKSKRINRNLSFIGIIILGVLVYVFGTSVYDGLNTVSPVLVYVFGTSVYDGLNTVLP